MSKRGVAAIVAGAVAVYAQALTFRRTWDDALTVVGHPGVQGPFSLRAIFARDFWGHSFGDPAAVGTYRPLVTLTYWLDVHVGRSWAMLHATNLVLYAAVLLLAARLFRAFELDDRTRLFALAAFGALAIHTDVVPSVTGRSELMAAAFVLLALERAIAGRTAVAALALLFAMLSKESTLPFAFAIPFVAARRGVRATPIFVACLSALVAVVGFRAGRLPFGVRAPGWEISNPLIDAPGSLRVGGVGHAVAEYLGHTFAPIELCPDYGYASIVPAFGFRAILGFAAIAAVLVAAVVSFKRAPRVTDACVLLGASYVVVSHIAVPSSAFVADRQFFLPSLFLVLLIAIALEPIALRRARAAAAIAGMFILVQVMFTLLALPAWRDDAALTAHAIRACPTGVRMRTFRGELAHARGAIDETAWSFLVAGAVVDRFPAPVDEDAFPGEWDALPIAERLTRLRGAIGPERFGRARARADDALARKGYRDAIALLATW